MFPSRTIWTAGAVAFLSLSAAPLSSWARTIVVERPLVLDPDLLPAAAAPAGLEAPVLGSLNYSGAAPPDVRLRVVEDEPYSYLTGLRCDRRLASREGFSAIELRGLLAAGEAYRARISLEWEPRKSKQLHVLRRFDLAAQSAYLTSAVQSEQREKGLYAVHEVRSPLGIAEDVRGRLADREYLSYTAAVSNPLSVDYSAATPYNYASGKLMAVIETRDAYWLIAVEFEARRFPHSLRLTENLARLVACQLLSLHQRSGPEILAYPPEYELPQGGLQEHPVDPATADLAEQPADECGLPSLQPGGYLPPCPAGNAGPARPYGGHFSRCIEQAAEACTCSCDYAGAEAAAWSSTAAGQGYSARPPASGQRWPASGALVQVSSVESPLALKLRRHAASTTAADAELPADPQGWADADAAVEPEAGTS